MKSVKGIAGSEFKVGSIVYFISGKTEQVIPALVSEKIVRSSLGCEIKVTYVLKIRQGKSFKSIEVDPLQTEFFEDPADVKSFMMERTTHAIDKLVTTAIAASKLLKPDEESAQSQVDQLDMTVQSSGDEPIEVTLPDGKVAKFRM
jgi:hypothetical protein|tara:strand:+ start:2988 stop:3425 length:438 start_codon:yes stop_codon:yes gene_type:complete